MKCPSCGKENGEKAKKCDECGTFLGPVLKTERPSEDEVPNNVVMAIGSLVVPLLCIAGGPLSLLALPVGAYAFWQARQVDEHVRRKDVASARIASINAKKYSLAAVALAFVLGIANFVLSTKSDVEDMRDAVKRDIPTDEP